MAGYNQRQLNNGQQGSGSGLDADSVDTKDASSLGSDHKWNKVNEKSVSATSSIDVAVTDQSFDQYMVIPKINSPFGEWIQMSINNDTSGNHRYVTLNGTENIGATYIEKLMGSKEVAGCRIIVEDTGTNYIGVDVQNVTYLNDHVVRGRLHKGSSGSNFESIQFKSSSNSNFANDPKVVIYGRNI
jgi:hypothetical protein